MKHPCNFRVGEVEMENPWGFLINQPRLFGKSWSSQRICLKKKEREDGKKERKKWGGERNREREGEGENIRG